MTKLECAIQAEKIMRENANISEYVNILVYLVAVSFSLYTGYKFGRKTGSKPVGDK